MTVENAANESIIKKVDWVSLNIIAEEVHNLAVDKGWWEEDRNDGELIALIHSELSEALEALRKGNPPCDKPVDLTALEEELADVIIRVFDMAYARGINIGRAVMLKHEYNKTRPHRHGGKAF